MSRRMVGRFTLLFCVVAGSIAAPRTSDAAFLDWLFPRRQERLERRLARSQGVTAYYPVTTANYGGGSACGTPACGTTAYYGGGTAIAPRTYYTGYGSWQGWNRMAAPVAYRPTTTYRTIWAPVPVTSYRPIGGNLQQACNTYTWQARRVPYISYQPVAAAPADYAPCVPDPTCNTCAGAATACSTCPTTAYAAPSSSCSSCAGGACTVNYGSDDGWQPVTTAGYASGFDYANNGSTTAQYSGSDWQPATSSGSDCASCNVAADTAPTISRRVESNTEIPAGATEWRPVTESEQQPLQPAPADLQPTLDDMDHQESFRRLPSDDWRVESRPSPHRTNDPRDFDRSEFYRQRPDEVAPTRFKIQPDENVAANQRQEGRDLSRGWYRERAGADATVSPPRFGSAPSNDARFGTDSHSLPAEWDGWNYAQDRGRPSYDWRASESQDKTNLSLRPVPKYRPVNPVDRPDSDQYRNRLSPSDDSAYQRPWLTPIPTAEEDRPSPVRPIPDFDDGNRTAQLTSYDRWQAQPIELASRSSGRREVRRLEPIAAPSLADGESDWHSISDR